MNQQSLLDLARQYHGDLPDRIRRYLNERGIPNPLIDLHLLGWNGSRIAIPIFNREGDLAFFKLARDPEDSHPGAKMLATPGARAELYGWGEVLSPPQQIIICEGEFDRLVLEAHGFQAVTSTGGAGVFREEWAREFEAIPEVYICFDRDEAGQRGALRVGWLIPHARIVTLPEEVGEGGDVTDFFVRLGRSADDFKTLLTTATPALPRPAQRGQVGSPYDRPPARGQVEELKQRVPIAEVIGREVTLRPGSQTLVGTCPFHEDHVPSFTVYPDTGRFYCFGCGKKGDVITFLRELRHLTFPEALDVLERWVPAEDGPRPGEE